ncbi:hypothetical protein CCR75_004422 [Bremia lactucae]|uniref:Uncharacterized protein n=1 Tax=Bremia lactucae TaxID=4779 RepID=A0A976IH30_BRELC|nr:hypothetical protein CCR75_004422 [Bremia lactucae]
MESTSSDTAALLSYAIDACVCLLVLLFSTALFQLLRVYTRRRGYIEIQQDDRSMYSNVLLTASDSWENIRAADSNKLDVNSILVATS